MVTWHPSHFTQGCEGAPNEYLVNLEEVLNPRDDQAQLLEQDYPSARLLAGSSVTRGAKFPEPEDPLLHPES